METEALIEKVLANFTAENLARPPSRREIYTFTLESVGETIDLLSDEIKGLLAKVEELQKSGARFRGVYQRAATYRLGDQATHKGSLWTALGDVPEGTPPGDSPNHWQLAAKGTG